jgi:leader peptidase (prepilin peptidase)/N-methyltransferase
MFAWPQPFVTLYVFVLGCIVGSFLNVVIYRLPRRRSVVLPSSSCPSCEAAIRWFDNIPILSWLLLLGRCRRCKAPIPIRYPAVEAAAGLMAALAFQRHGLSVSGVEMVVFSWVSLVLGLIDLEHQILPDVLTYPSIVFGLAASWFGGLTPWLSSVVGAAMGAALPIAVILLYRLLRGEEGMGWGDVKYLAAIGAVVGVHNCLWVLVVAAIVGALVGGILIALGRGSGKTALPFGTFLALAVVVWLYVPESWRLWSLW